MLAIYTRVSTDDQAEKGLSLDNQQLRGGMEITILLVVQWL